MRVIDEHDQQLGILPTASAVATARERGLDLVEVAPTATPPVCRILDYDAFRYERQKHEREARKQRKRQEIKEVRLGVKIGAHDLETKVRRAGGFLAGGDRVKLTVRFRGREITHPQLGRDLLYKATAMLAAAGEVERAPLLEGKNMWLLLTPAKAGPDATVGVAAK